MKERGLAYLLGLTLTLTLGMSSTVYATVMACTPNIADNVEGAAACQYSDTAFNGNPASETAFVNSEGYFGINDWEFAGKEDEDGDSDSSGVDIGFEASFIDSGQSGEWRINEVAFANWESIMLLFKDGANTQPVGYLLALTSGISCTINGVCTGTWESPFEDPPFDFNPDSKIKDVSHISAFVSDSTVAVPEPATLMLLGIGLLGMVRVGRWVR